MFSSWPCSALVEGVKIGSGSWSDSLSLLGQADAAHLARGLVFLPAGAGEIAADDALDRDDPGPLDQHRTLVEELAMGGEGGRELVRVGGDEVIGADELGEVEPEPRQLRQDLALEGDERGQDVVEGRDAVRGDDQELVADFIDVPDLAFLEQRVIGQNDIGKSVFHVAPFRRVPGISRVEPMIQKFAGKVKSGLRDRPTLTWNPRGFRPEAGPPFLMLAYGRSLRNRVFRIAALAWSNPRGFSPETRGAQFANASPYEAIPPQPSSRMASVLEVPPRVPRRSMGVALRNRMHSYGVPILDFGRLSCSPSRVARGVRRGREIRMKVPMAS